MKRTLLRVVSAVILAFNLAQVVLPTLPAQAQVTSPESAPATPTPTAPSSESTPPPASTGGSTQCVQRNPAFPVRLGVSIGGVSEVNGLTEYINVVYRYMTSVVLVITIVMITYGGFRYLLSATSLGVSDGKDIIKNGLIGMVLVLSAYVILYTINPATTVLQFTQPPEDIRCASVDVNLQMRQRGNDECEEDSDCGTGKKCVMTQVVAQNLSDSELLVSGGGGAAVGGYVAGPIGAVVGGVGTMIYRTSDGVHKCTDGSAGSPCGNDDHCQSTNTCVADWNLCIPKTGNARGVPCDTGEEGMCASGLTCQATDVESWTEDWAVCRGNVQHLTWEAIRTNNYRIPDAMRCFQREDCEAGYVCMGPDGLGKKYCVFGSNAPGSNAPPTIVNGGSNPTPCFQSNRTITPILCGGSRDQSVCVVCHTDNKWRVLDRTTDPNATRIGACDERSVIGTNCR